MIKRIEIDGNDGTGKSYLCSKLKDYLKQHNLENRFEVFDRGLLTKATLENLETYDNFVKTVLPKFRNDTIYIIIDDTARNCQERILSRGDSINQAFHNSDDLNFYRRQYKMLYDHMALAYPLDYNGNSRMPLIMLERENKSKDIISDDEKLEMFFKQLIYGYLSDNLTTTQEKVESKMVDAAYSYYQAQIDPKISIQDRDKRHSEFVIACQSYKDFLDEQEKIMSK